MVKPFLSFLVKSPALVSKGIGALFGHTSKKVGRAINEQKAVRRFLVIWSAGIITASFWLIYEVVMSVVNKIVVVDEHAAAIVSSVVGLLTISSSILGVVIGQYTAGRNREDVASKSSQASDPKVETSPKAPTFENPTE